MSTELPFLSDTLSAVRISNLGVLKSSDAKSHWLVLRTPKQGSVPRWNGSIFKPYLLTILSLDSQIHFFQTKNILIQEMVAENSSVDLVQRMKRLRALMAKSTKTQSSLQVCVATKWRGTSHVKKMRKSALSRKKLLQGIAISEKVGVNAIASTILSLKHIRETSKKLNKQRRADSGSCTRSRQVQKYEQIPRISSLNTNQLRSIVEYYQRSRKFDPMNVEQKMAIVAV